jgi:hypothetical protein
MTPLESGNNKKKRKQEIGLAGIRSWSRSYLVVLAAFAGIATLAVVLSALYRDAPKATEVLDRKRRANAKFVSFAVVFGNVSPALRERVITDIATDIGADTALTDMVVGSTVADPWCAGIGEYKRQLSMAMTQSRTIPIGKQTLIMSMIAGFLNKSDLPARVYLIGNLNNDQLTEKGAQAIISRTEQTVAAISWRHGARAPVTVISYMDTTSSSMNVKYVNLFRNAKFALENR